MQNIENIMVWWEFKGFILAATAWYEIFACFYFSDL